jgi:CRISPR-associated protein Csc3
MKFEDLEGESTSEALQLYLREVAPTLSPYRDVVQTGIREGVTLLDHLMNGALFIGSILPAFDFDEAEIRTLLAAFTLHDANKMLEDTRSLAKVSLSADFDVLWERHRVDVLVDPGRHELVRTLVVNTSYKHGKTADALLGGPALTQDVKRLRTAMTAADIHDLSPSFDETRQKQRLCEHLREVTGKPLVLFSHQIHEDLGSFSALAHTAASTVMERHGAVQVWVYPEGSWYLAPCDIQIPGEELRSAWSKAREEAFGGGGIGLFVDRNVKDGFKLDPKALERWSDAAIAVEMADLVLQKDAAPLLETITRRQQGKELPEGCRWPQTVEEVLPGRLWLAAENLLKAGSSGKEPTQLLLTRLSTESSTIVGPFETVLKSAVDLHPVYDRPYVLMASIPEPSRVAQRAFEVAAEIVRAKEGIEEGQERLPPEVEAWLATVQFGGSPPNPRQQALAALALYTTGERSSLGAARGPVEDLTSNLVPKDTPVSQFSNRILAGKREPKRQRDALQAEVLRIQTKVAPITASAPLYVHVRPRKGPTPAGWHASAGSLARQVAGREETALVSQLRFHEKQLVREFHAGWTGFVPVQRRVLHGNGFTLPWAPNNKLPELDNWLAAASTAAAIAEELGVDVVLSGQPIASRHTLRLTLVGVPVLARWLFAEQIADEELVAMRARIEALEELAARHHGKDWNTAALLVRAGSRGLMALFAALDKRAETTGATTGAREVELLLTLYPETKMSKNEREIFASLVAMAKLAEAKLKTSDFKRNDLARPLNELFKALRRTRAEADLELALAVAEDRIFEAKATDASKAGFDVGRPTREAAAAFVVHARALAAAYGSLARLRADERVLRSAFITLVRRESDLRRATQNPQE